jgi:hypothetical protein
MESRHSLSENEKALLTCLLEAGNYQAARVSLSTSELLNRFKFDMTDLAYALDGLSTHGLIRLTSLPRALEDVIAYRIQRDLDALDLRYLESKIIHTEYVSSRQALAEQLKAFPSHCGPASPLDSAKIFRERERVLDRIFQLNAPARPSRPSDELENGLRSVSAKLLSFRKLMQSRINETLSKMGDEAHFLDEKRNRMLLLFSQVGMSRLATAKDVAQDLLEELELLRARRLVGEVSEADLGRNEDIIWEGITRRFTPQLPSDEDLERWKRELNARLSAAKDLKQKDLLSTGVFQIISEDLNDDIALLDSCTIGFRRNK